MEKKIVKAPPMRKLKETAVEPPYQSDKARKYDPRPVFNISAADLPEITKWNIDTDYTLTVKVNMTGIREEDFGANKGKKVASFKITSIGVEK